MGLGIYFLSLSQKDKKELNEIQKLVDNYNQFSDVYKEVDGVAYINQFGYECFQYNGSDANDVKSKASEIFEYSFRPEGNISEVDGNLYICKPNNCKIKKINKYEVLNVNDGRKILSVDLSDLVIEKVDNVWKFVIYNPLCELDG